MTPHLMGPDLDAKLAYIYIVVDVVLGCHPGVQDQVVVPVVDDEDAAGLDELVKVGDGLDVVVVVAVVRQVGERVPHADDGVVATFTVGIDVLVFRQVKPVSFLND